MHIHHWSSDFLIKIIKNSHTLAEEWISSFNNKSLIWYCCFFKCDCESEYTLILINLKLSVLISCLWFLCDDNSDDSSV